MLVDLDLLQTDQSSLGIFLGGLFPFRPAGSLSAWGFGAESSAVLIFPDTVKRLQLLGGVLLQPVGKGGICLAVEFQGQGAGG